MKRRKAAPGAPEGGLVMDKAAGITSHDVVAIARRILGQPRIGHTGTLDPLATGVLPLLLGRATRLAQYLAADEKAYEAVVRFGQATSTYDAEGAPVGPSVETRVDRAALEAALEQLRGTRLQMPPAVSAKRVGGHRAYDLARRDTVACADARRCPAAPCQRDTLRWADRRPGRGVFGRVLCEVAGARSGPDPWRWRPPDGPAPHAQRPVHPRAAP